MNRIDGRNDDQLRPVKIESGYLRNAEGSARIRMGETVVICAATIEDRVPGWLRGEGRGWVTAEYGMLPRSTTTRVSRDIGRPSGRTVEIQRLIGRSLRAVVDLASFGERTVTVDCDVIEADGGTRTASISGACVALHRAFQWLVDERKIPYHPMRDLVAGVSVGMVAGRPCLDLNYHEDSAAAVDMNIVMTGSGEFVELQGTAESVPFSDAELRLLLRHGKKGIRRLLTIQRKALGIKA